MLAVDRKSLTTEEVCKALGINRGSLYTIRLAAQVQPEKRIVNGRVSDFHSPEQVEKMRAFLRRRKEAKR